MSSPSTPQRMIKGNLKIHRHCTVVLASVLLTVHPQHAGAQTDNIREDTLQEGEGTRQAATKREKEAWVGWENG